MALTTIKQANRKWKHELARRKKKQKRLIEGLDKKASNKILREELITQRRERMERREKEIAYVNELERSLQ